MSNTDKPTITTRWIICVLMVSIGFAVLLAVVAHIFGYNTIDEAMTGYILGVLAMATVGHIPTGGK